MREIKLSATAAKFLKNLPDDYKEAIKLCIQELESDLTPRGAIRLTGHDSCFRIRVGPFRIQYYFMEKENVVLVYKISRRDETTYK